nr:homeodomain-like protein [Tanacetum cinerariifolium]
MPPEPVSIDRKELKPSLSESDATVGWKDMPSTPSSCRWPGGGGARPFSGHGKGVGEERKTSPNGTFNSHVDFVNSWEQVNSGDGVGVGTTGDKQGLEKGKSLGSSGLDWKPVKWIRSGSLSSRGSGFSHSNSFDNKMEGQLGGGCGETTTLLVSKIICSSVVMDSGDGNRIQTGLPSLPDSAVLLAKYPAAFTPFSASSKLDQDQLHFFFKKSKKVLQPFAVDKKLLPGIPRSKGLEVTSGVATGSGYTTSVVTVRFVESRVLNDCLLASNKATAKSASDELSNLLPTTSHCTRICRDTNVSVLKKNFTMRKRFLKFKERVITFKFRAFQHSWKEDLRLLALKKCGSKSHKKLEHTDHQKRHSRLTYPDGSFSMVPTTEIVEYMNKLLPDSQVRTYRSELKMPSLILDNRERMSSRFISDNGLVEDPIGIEKEKSVVNAWSVEEKEIFLNKYSLFGKNFKKISSFLQRRSIADCVEFYYKNHKSDLFQKIKKKMKFVKGRSSTTTSTYLVTSGKRPSQTTSLDMLGAASAMVANVGTSSGDGDRLNDFANLCNEQETAAADVLAGICGSISPEALGSCITSSVDHGDIRHQVRTCQKLGGYLLQNVGEDDSCSDDSRGEEMESCNWTDEEKSNLMKGLKLYGKNFLMVSRCVRTKTSNQCKVYYSKARNLLGLDVIKFEPGSEGTTDANHGGGSDQDHEGTCMVDSGSVISRDKSFLDCKMEPHSSDFGEEHSESDLNVVNKEPEPLVSDIKSDEELVGERGSNGNMEGAADSEATEAANLEISPQNTCSDSASGAKVEESEHLLANGISCNGNAIEDLNSTSYYSRGRSLDLTLDRGNGMDLNASLENMSTQEPVDGLVVSNLFPQDPTVIPKRRTVSQDDVSSRLSFRKSSQRCSSTDGYHLHLPKHSLLDCAESSQILRGCTVTVSNNKGINGTSNYDKTQCNFKLDESLLMPTDASLQMCNERRRSSSSDVEKPSGNGDPVLKANGGAQEGEKPNGVKSYNLKFDHHRKVASLDLTRRNDYSSGVENNLQLSSHGFWDGNRIQTGFPSLPDSAGVTDRVVKKPDPTPIKPIGYILVQKKAQHWLFNKKKENTGFDRAEELRFELLGVVQAFS